ncbi:hypothetical protein P3T76_001897 [Phytophthora citrophthora]|uniref:Uncharacterized protein n=1 Tax=Phytophthora citrophthora TaxID=4793 RepID=A0AAD9LTM6_9STRA|nr:hypothetical protein P3T76_001897 [Phytophthora citrophthora]
MRMLAMNSLMHDAERRRQDRTSRVVHSSMASGDTDKEEDEMDDEPDVDELDPVDGFPSPPVRVRPRRRFVKPGQTTYELSFSRRNGNTRRARRTGLKEQENEGNKLQERDDYSPALPGAARPCPAVSSLSSVLTEVMTGKTKALNNIVDTTPPQPNVTYVVEHAPDGTPYVAASDGNKYFENSTIGQIFLKSAPNHTGPKGRRSDLDFLQSGGWNHQTQAIGSRRSDFVGADATATATVGNLPMETGTKSGEQGANGDIDAKKGSKSLLGFKGFHMGKKKDKKGSASDLKAVQEQEDHSHTPVLGTHETIVHQHEENDFPMLDHEMVDRNRADSSWEVPPAKFNVPEVQQPTPVRLLDSTGMETAQQARTDLLMTPKATNDSIASGSSSLGSASAASSTSSGVAAAPAKTLPRLQPKKDLPAPPLAFDAYDEDDNPLCMSFQNLRDVDLIHSKSDDEDDDEDHEHEHEHDKEHEDAAAAVDEDFPDVNSPDFAGRVRVSSGATSVAEFVGGFKGQLSRRSGTNGLVNRKRAVRHARLTAEEQKAADLARKIREARNRIPLEFRDEYMSLAAQNELKKKKKWRALGRHVHFNTDVLVREFEVESEDEDDGYDSPDEIVDAVQLVSKRDVVHAEDVVAAFPMEQLELPAEEPETIAQGFPLPPTIGTGGEDQTTQDDPLTFSQLNNDKRLSFSDL